MSLYKYALEFIWVDEKNQIKSIVKIINLSFQLTLKTNLINLPNIEIEIYKKKIESYKVASNILLQPRQIFQNPFKNFVNYLIFCEPLSYDKIPTDYNKRVILNRVYQKLKKKNVYPHFGFKQQYILYDYETNKPLGWNKSLIRVEKKQGFCCVGENVFGRNIAYEHCKVCLKAGINISSVNSGNFPSQWSFRIKMMNPVKSCDQLWVARYILLRICEKHKVYSSFGKDTVNVMETCKLSYFFNTKKMGELNGIINIKIAINALLKHHEEFMILTCRVHKRKNHTHNYDKIFTWGIGNSNSLIKIPFKVNVEKKGYFEDERANGYVDPYDISIFVLKNSDL